jgi:hypothetical protein
MPSASTHPVNAAFFGLAFIAELKLKLLGAEAIVACGRGDRIGTYARVSAGAIAEPSPRDRLVRRLVAGLTRAGSRAVVTHHPRRRNPPQPHDQQTF